MPAFNLKATAIPKVKALLRSAKRKVAPSDPLKLVARRTLTLDTPEFASEHDTECPVGALNRSGMFSVAFKYMYGNRMEGDYLEFGCFSARTFRMAYTHSRRAFSRPSSCATVSPSFSIL